MHDHVCTTSKRFWLYGVRVTQGILSRPTILEKSITTYCSVIKFLASRGLAFRGDNQTLASNQNGNYLGILELVSQFDPFLCEHLK